MNAVGDYEQLPYEIHRVLKGVAAKLLKGIESDVLGELVGRRPRQADRLPLWTCMMQVVSLYHDLIGIVSSQGRCQVSINHLNVPD